VPEGGVDRIAFSPDGEMLAPGHHNIDGEKAGVVLWDVAGRSRLAPKSLAVPEAYLSSVPFSPDGKILAAGYLNGFGGGNGDVVLWDVDLNSRKRIAEEIANRNFTREEWRRNFPDPPSPPTFKDLPEPP
jgi:WD40 repeat protein